MREIEFRGQREDTKKWVYGYLLRMFDEISIMDKKNENLVFPVDKNTVGQFTGKTDSQGTKVFEGDLLEYDEDIFNGVEFITQRKSGVVTFAENGTWCAGRLFSLSAVIANNSKVVGTIYEEKER